jgi:hypothetical protein
MKASIGAPPSASEETVATALGEAIARPNNPFAILVGEGETYKATFPMDVLDYRYADGTCWVSNVNCATRTTTRCWSIRDGSCKRDEHGDGAWLVDNIDWQDCS